MESGGMEADWKPSPPPEVGSPAWKTDIAISWAIDHLKMDKTSVIKIPNYEGHKIGYLVICKDSYGVDYFRVDDIT